MTRPLLAILFLASLVGCATGSPPNAFERQAYYVTTNWVPQVTQLAQVSSNMIGTNAVLVVTNVIYQTNLVGVPHFEPRESVKATIQTGGTLSALFGAPWLIPLFGLLGALYGGYAKYKNNQADKRVDKAEILNTVLAQGIETAKEIMVLTSPPSVEKKFVEKVKSEQVKAGVKPEAAKVVSEQVDTGAAKDAAAAVLSPAPVVVVSNGNSP